MFDQLDPLEQQKDEILAARGITGGSATAEGHAPGAKGRHRVPARRRGPSSPDDPAGRSTPCSIPWPTCSAPPASSGTPATARSMMREAVSLMGGYGITEDCPGFLGHKWMDAQLEATYEGPEAVQRRQLSVTMTDELFLAQFRQWIREMRADRQRPSRHRRLRPGHRHADVAVDARPPAEGHRRRWRQALPELAPGRDLPAGRRAVLAAGLALPDPRRAGARKEGPRESHGGRRACRACSRSSPTCATCRRRAPPAKWAASAPSWCSATTAIPPGTPKAAPPATRPTTWKPWRA